MRILFTSILRWLRAKGCVDNHFFTRKRRSMLSVLLSSRETGAAPAAAAGPHVDLASGCRIHPHAQQPQIRAATLRNASSTASPLGASVVHLKLVACRRAALQDAELTHRLCGRARKMALPFYVDSRGWDVQVAGDCFQLRVAPCWSRCACNGSATATKVVVFS